MAKEFYTGMGEWSNANFDKAPGYFGGKREETFKEYDQLYGKGNWKLAWLLGEELRSVYVNYEMACEIYELAYIKYFEANPDILWELTTKACNVYDDAETNVQSGFDYTKQETERTHIQDIAIRNAVYKLGWYFEGRELIQIRSTKGKHRLSKILSPGSVPFHDPKLITTPSNLEELYKRRWWELNSVEDFYQRNKRLLVRGR